MEIDRDGAPRLFWIIKYQEKHNKYAFVGEVLLLGFFLFRVLRLGFEGKLAINNPRGKVGYN